MYIFSNRLSSNRFGSCNDTDLSVKLCVLEAAVIKNQVLGGISQDFRASSLELESSSYAYEKLPLAEHKLLGKNNA